MAANKLQPDMDHELPSGGKEEIMAWVIEWAKERVKEEEEERTPN